MNEEQARVPAADGRLYGWVVIVASLLILGGMFRHPSLGGSDIFETVRLIVQQGGFNSKVHGFLMAIMLILVWGYLGFSQRLEKRPLAMAGFIAFSAGTFAGICAAITAGFAIRSVATAYLAATPDQADTVTGLLRVLGAFNFAWGRMWIVATSTGILLWGLALVGTKGAPRLVGWMGVAAGAGPALGIVSGVLPLSVGGTIAAIAAQTLWGVSIGALMIKGRL